MYRATDGPWGGEAPPFAAAWPAGVAVGFAAVLGVAFYALVGEGRSLQWDNGAHNLPLTLEAARQWFAGRLPAWNPFLWSGSPLLADVQAMAFYPPALLAHALTRDDPLQAMHVLCAMHVAIASCGIALLARFLGLSAAGALLAATVFSLNPYAIETLLSFVNIYGTAAWLPWQVLAVAKLVTARSPARALLPAAMAVALGWLAGYPAVWIFGSLFVAAVALALVPRGRLRRIGLVPLAYALGLGLVAFQVLPFLALGFGSNRMTPPDQRGVDFAPWDFVGAFVPGLLTARGSVPSSSNIAHLGLLPGALALVALARASRLRVVLALLAAVGVVLSMGSSVGLSDLLFELPLLRLLRKASLFYIVWVSTAVGLLAGFGLDDVLRAPRRWHAVALGSVIVVSVATFVAHEPRTGLGPPSPVRQTAALVVAALTTAGVGAAALYDRRRVAAALAVSGVLFAMLVEDSIHRAPDEAALARYAEPPDPSLWETLPATEPLAGWRSSNGARVFWGVSILEPRGHPDLRLAIAPYWKVEMASGYSALLDPAYARAVDFFESGSLRGLLTTQYKNNRVLDVLSTPYVFLRRSAAVASRLRDDPWVSLRPVGQDRLLVTRRRTLPRVRFVTNVARLPTRSEAIDRVRSGRIALQRTVLLDAEDAPSAQVATGARAACPAQTLATAPGRIELATSCPEGGFLVLSERWAPGWRAEIDGASVPVHRAYGLVLGIDVPPGARRLTVFHRPPGFFPGMLAALVVLASLTGLRIAPTLGAPAGPEAEGADG